MRLRILDFPHAAEYVAKIGQAVLGAGSASLAEWLPRQLHDLKHGQETAVLRELTQLRDRAVQAGSGSEVLKDLETRLAYLEKRRTQLRYGDFRAAGYPIGSGAVESGNKLVTEARLKGAGMHWAPAHVNSAGGAPNGRVRGSLAGVLGSVERPPAGAGA